ncbi:MAG: aminotransferase, partial [Clostridia bacterium]|nr:aminotransferase [Clostridia bacterium]
GPNKLNQLCHARMFPDTEALLNHMKLHAAVLRPKFEACLESFERELSGKGIAEWTKPLGGYFISMMVLPGTAKRVGELCKEAGLAITKPGATYPYGKDPLDSNIRIAPSYPSAGDMAKAADVLSVAVKYAALEKLICDKK